MRSIFFFLLFPFIYLQGSEAEWVGKKIFQNECSSSIEKLVWWNDREDFVSCGIGHFIWYPQGANKVFSESFPDFIRFLQQKKIKTPKWLKINKGCPWTCKEEFELPQSEKKKKQLRKLLKTTLSLQSEFIYQHFETTIPNLLESFSAEKQIEIQKKISILSQSKQGRYALLDYLNFKGSGTSEKERYADCGWGLKQVLEEMEIDPSNPTLAFAQAAQKVLERRVKNSDPKRQENRWLPGWLVRIQSYSTH